MSRLPFAPPAEDLRVDIEAGRLEFTTRPGSSFNAQEFRRAIEDAGYAVGAITVDGKAVEATDATADPPNAEADER